MKYITILALIVFGLQTTIGQDNSNKDVIDLAKIYRSFHFSNEPPTNIFEEIESINNTKLNLTKEFISELIKTNNEITKTKYLSKPDTNTLKTLYVIRGLNWNMHEDEPKDINVALDSLLNEETQYNELVSCYYGMLFTSVGNKNRPFDLTQTNFTLNEYNLDNDTEKGIFFLESMETFGTLIWGYINVPKPPNFAKAQEIISKYPKYNSQPYYQYLDLNFKDFLITTDKTKPKESFKSYYLNKYMNTVLYNAMCFSKDEEKQDQVNNIFLGSIIKNEAYWKYSETPEIFENIFKKVER